MPEWQYEQRVITIKPVPLRGGFRPERFHEEEIPPIEGAQMAQLEGVEGELVAVVPIAFQSERPSNVFYAVRLLCLFRKPAEANST